MNVFTSYLGDNSLLIEKVIGLYAKNGCTIADVTYGRGVFWRKVDVLRFNFLPSDTKTCPKSPHDFRHLPYADGSIDVVVFDPPYTHNPGNMMVESRYRNAETTGGMYHDDILLLYRDGIAEARRVLRDGGTLWLKCKDELESSTQRWSHIELLIDACKMGFYAKDLFILTQKSPAIVQCRQLHARKNHSYLWIFEKSGDMKKIAVQNAALRGIDHARKAGRKVSSCRG